ncbi:MAG: CoA transferase subunit A [Oscillospiraceae bacterium]
MNKVVNSHQAIEKITDGSSILVSGFVLRGAPNDLLKALLDKGVKNLTIITNDSGLPGENAIWALMEAGRVRKFVCSFLGLNPASGKMMMEHPEMFEIIPQGTLAEKIRCGGSGIPGFLTPVGVDTEIEKGKTKIVMGGKVCLLEESIHADVALIHATKADAYGNCFLRGSNKCFGAIMPMAADYVIAEAEEIVEVGGIDPELVTVPAVFVDAVVKVGEYNVGQ